AFTPPPPISLMHPQPENIPELNLPFTPSPHHIVTPQAYAASLQHHLTPHQAPWQAPAPPTQPIYYVVVSDSSTTPPMPPPSPAYQQHEFMPWWQTASQ